jgi:hypothetical protein
MIVVNGGPDDYATSITTIKNTFTVDVVPTSPSELLNGIELDQTIEKKNMVDKLELGWVCDAAHLDKNIRSYFEKHYIQINQKFVDKKNLPGGVVKFEYVREAIEFQEDNELTIAPQLNKKKVSKLNSFQKMDVFRSMAVLNHKTANLLTYLVENENFPEEALLTAYFINMVAKWFNILKCRTDELAFSLRNPEKYKEMIDFLEEFMEFFATLKITTDQWYWMQVQQGVILTTKTILWLQHFLLNEGGLTYFRPGTTLADCLESFHGVVRDVNPVPDCKEYMQIIKGICLGQLLNKKRKRGRSYELDDAKDYLTHLENVKKLDQENDPESMEDNIVFIESNFEPGDFCETVALTYFGGYILFKVLKKRTTCQTCFNFWIAKDGDDFKTHPDCYLIRCSEYVENGLVTPTKVGAEIFEKAEAWFKSNRFSQRHKKGLTKILTNLITDRISKDYEVPVCHLEMIIKRFVNSRLQFWANFINRNMKEVNADLIEQASHASKTARRAEVVPS